jgi:hypothetical protein
MKKFAIAALLLVVYAAPAFAWSWHHHPKTKPSHPQAIHAQNPYLKHPTHRKPHAVPKTHPS